MTGSSARRDHERFVGHLYESRGRELYAFARRLGLSDEESWDAVQEAHLRLWRSLASGIAIDDAAAWIFAALYRLAMDQHRFSRRLRGLFLRLAAPTEPVALDRTDRVAVWTAVDALPARQRAAVYLRYRADLSFEQVGRVMGVTPGAARTYASRGIAAVRALLADPVEARSPER